MDKKAAMERKARSREEAFRAALASEDFLEFDGLPRTTPDELENRMRLEAAGLMVNRAALQDQVWASKEYGGVF